MSEVTIEEYQNLRQQLECRIFEAMIEFEQITGVQVERIDIIRSRKIGFGSVDTIEVDVITDI